LDRIDCLGTFRRPLWRLGMAIPDNEGRLSSNSASVTDAYGRRYRAFYNAAQRER
jgi:hypothetical protein